MSEQIKFTCSICNEKYSHYRTLKQHVKKWHSDQSNVLAPNLRDTKEYQYPCAQCSRKYNDPYNLNSHVRKMHDLVTVSNGKRCPLCNFESSKDLILSHFEDVHSIKIKTENINFDDFNKFLSWKNDTEKEFKCKFNLKRGKIKTKNNTLYYYTCHRSGFYVPRGQGKRHLKTQGSNKIDAYCPAAIKAVVSEVGSCIVSFTSTHVGHNNDIGHIFLTEAERLDIATKIQTKVPFDEILNEVRDSISNSNLERIHLITKKDLYNIENCFNLNSCAIKHKDDGISVDAWVKDIENRGGTFILLYKPQGTTLDLHPTLNENDFILIIMNDAQSEMLKKYGSDCVSIDGTHGTNSYDFELVTLLVVDDMRQGFPCAFLFSNRTDSEVIEIFYSKIKENVGEIKPSVFMSDMAESFYNAWVKTFHDKPEHQLYCTWHVDRAWRKNLSKIKLKDKQVEVYKVLRTVMHETDIETFNILLEQAVNLFLHNDLTTDFGKYFVENYVKCVERWAYCHRLQCGLNTNMHAESMHRTIKYVYLKGKQAKRLDKTIHALMKFLRDKLIDRLIILNKGKLTSKLRDLRIRHKNSLSLQPETIMENANGFIVPSSSEKFIETYLVQEITKDRVCQCQLVCTDCNVCIHNYSCTCLDSSIKWNMCKHIHLVCRYKQLKNKKSDKNTNDEDNLFSTRNLCINDDDVNTIPEADSLLSELSKNNTFLNTQTFAEKKESIKRNYIEIIDTISTVDELKVLENVLKSLHPSLIAARTLPEKQILAPSTLVKHIPHNKHIETQRRLFSVKKKKRKTESTITKPSQEESQKIALSLIMNTSETVPDLSHKD